MFVWREMHEFESADPVDPILDPEPNRIWIDWVEILVEPIL